jgi:hypothetical protein
VPFVAVRTEEEVVDEVVMVDFCRASRPEFASLPNARPVPVPVPVVEDEVEVVVAVAEPATTAFSGSFGRVKSRFVDAALAAAAAAEAAVERRNEGC